MKYYAFITDPEAWANGQNFLRLEPTDGMKTHWQLVGEVEFEPEVDHQEVTARAIKEIDHDAADAQQALDRIEIRRQNVMSLPHIPEGEL